MTAGLRLAMEPRLTHAGVAYMPRTWGYLARGGGAPGRRLRTLVDSGAQLTVASRGLARELGFTAAELDVLPACEVGGFGGAIQVAREARLDLHVAPGGGELLALGDVRVFFVPQMLGDHELLLGQIGALERLSFEQYNHPRVREFVLRLPAAR